jgi:hypothetical protein
VAPADGAVGPLPSPDRDHGPVLPVTGGSLAATLGSAALLGALALRRRGDTSPD